MSGRFIVFEGLDGCGKSTQATLATSFLFSLNKENDILLTREPTRDFREIRSSLSSVTEVTKDPEWFARMFIADRKHHVQEYITPSLLRGTHVLCDRYKHSTLTFQQAQGIDLERLIDWHEGLPIPDLTIIFDLPTNTALERCGERGKKDLFERAEFQEQVRKNYLDLASLLVERGERVVVIPVTSIDHTAQQVQKHILTLFS